MILDVQLWELGTQRLHQGLSETILVDTLTDVREFKNMGTYILKSFLNKMAFTLISFYTQGHQGEHDAENHFGICDLFMASNIQHRSVQPIGIRVYI